MDDIFVTEARLLRERIAVVEDRLDRLAAAGPGGTHRMIGRVFSQGAIPTTAGKFYACHPVTVTGDEIEGATPVLTVDTDQVFFVDLLGGSAAVDDYLVCRRVRHRWVARSGAAPVANACFFLSWCGQAAGQSWAVPGATVTIDGSTTGTTDAAGNVCFTLAVGIHTYSATKTGYRTATGSFTVPTTGTVTTNVRIPPNALTFTGPHGVFTMALQANATPTWRLCYNHTNANTIVGSLAPCTPVSALSGVNFVLTCGDNVCGSGTKMLLSMGFPTEHCNPTGATHGRNAVCGPTLGSYTAMDGGSASVSVGGGDSPTLITTFTGSPLMNFTIGTGPSTCNVPAGAYIPFTGTAQITL